MEQAMTKDRLVRIVRLLERELGTDWLSQMASGLGVDRQTILEWGSGIKLPSPDELLKLSDFVRKLHHDQRGNDPKEWFRKGEELLAASDVLKGKIDEWWDVNERRREGQRVEYPPDVSQQFLMLRSFALECFLKGLIRQSGCPLVRNGMYIGQKHHTLTDYAKAAGLRLKNEENEMLDRLQKHNSLGRYPVLRRYEEDVFWSRIDRPGKCHWREPEDESTFVQLLAGIKERARRNVSKTL